MAIDSGNRVPVLGTLSTLAGEAQGMMTGPGKRILRMRFVRSAVESARFLLGLPEVVRYIVATVFQSVRILDHSRENSAIDQEKETSLASGILTIGVS